MTEKVSKIIVPIKIETQDDFLFKGLDGKEYALSEALAAANTAWFDQNHRYISAVTGKEYTRYDELMKGEEEYWSNQIISVDTKPPLGVGLRPRPVY